MFFEKSFFKKMIIFFGVPPKFKNELENIFCRTMWKIQFNFPLCIHFNKFLFSYFHIYIFLKKLIFFIFFFLLLFSFSF